MDDIEFFKNLTFKGGPFKRSDFLNGLHTYNWTRFQALKLYDALKPFHKKLHFEEVYKTLALLFNKLHGLLEQGSTPEAIEKTIKKGTKFHVIVGLIYSEEDDYYKFTINAASRN